jgi:hypothetical protein
MGHPIKEIEVTEKDGIYRVPVDFKSGFVLIPFPEGNMKLAFWDKSRLITFLECYGFSPIMIHLSSN